MLRHHLLETSISIDHVIILAKHYLGNFGHFWCFYSGLLGANPQCSLKWLYRKSLVTNSKKMAADVKVCITVNQGSAENAYSVLHEDALHPI